MVAYLHKVLERAVPDEPLGGAAAASAWLIDTLVAMLHQRALLADPEGHLPSTLMLTTACFAWCGGASSAAKGNLPICTFSGCRCVHSLITMFAECLSRSTCASVGVSRGP